jgi:hypothetical protein
VSLLTLCFHRHLFRLIFVCSRISLVSFALPRSFLSSFPFSKKIKLTKIACRNRLCSFVNQLSITLYDLLISSCWGVPCQSWPLWLPQKCVRHAVFKLRMCRKSPPARYLSRFDQRTLEIEISCCCIECSASTHGPEHPFIKCGSM